MWGKGCLVNDRKLFGIRYGHITILVEMLLCLLTLRFPIVNGSTVLRNTLPIRKLSP
jgi:hypothetical protein